MKHIVILVAGFLFMRWNINVVVESPPAISNLLLAVGAGLALGIYLVHALFDLIGTSRREYTWKP
jgi:hypothetical protein